MSTFKQASISFFVTSASALFAAIAVDTHVHRIFNTLGWVNTKTPEETERELIKILPKKYWSETNRLFVSIGRQYTTNKRLLEFLKNEELI
jgi:endonuclease III